MFPFGKLNRASPPNRTAASGVALALGIGVVMGGGVPLSGADNFPVNPSFATSVRGPVTNWQLGDFHGVIRATPKGPEVHMRAGDAVGHFTQSENVVRVGGHDIPAPSLKQSGDRVLVKDWHARAREHFGLNAKEANELKQVVKFLPKLEGLISKHAPFPSEPSPEMDR